MKMTFEEAMRKRIITVGDYIDYQPERKKCLLREELTGWEDVQIFETEQQLRWRFQRFKNHLLLVADDATDTKLWLKGKIAYDNGVTAMNKICKKLYSNPTLGVQGMSITEEINKHVLNIISDKSYWLGSSYVRTYTGFALFGMRYVYSGYVYGGNLYSSYGTTYGSCRGIRPVVSLKSALQVETLEGCDGSKERPWHIVMPKSDNNAEEQLLHVQVEKLKQLLQEGEKLVKSQEKWLEELKNAIANMK